VESFLSGTVAGYGIAIPVGAIATYIVALTARTSFRVGGSAAMGAATADGVYASVAVLGGAVLSSSIASVARPLQWVSGAVLLALAARIGYLALAEYRHPYARANVRRMVRSPVRAFGTVLVATLLNPTTVVYFAALVVAHRSSTPLDGTDGTLFVLGAFLASASWQLLLAAGGAVLGRVLMGPRGRLATGLVSALLISALAVWMVLLPG
jgi:arginine exporter protein ArgO